MGILDLNTIKEALQIAGKIEFYPQILEAQEKLLEQQKKISDLEMEAKDLREKLEIKDSLISERNMYWVMKKEKKDGPFCTNCWDSEKKLMRLHKSESHSGIQCPKCKIWTVSPTATVHRFGIDNDWRNSGR